jgi:hypothetical protein
MTDKWTLGETVTEWFGQRIISPVSRCRSSGLRPRGSGSTIGKCLSSTAHRMVILDNPSHKARLTL